ncbi:MAG: SCP2 sterol-binding domain-containing protein, partial [Zoogloeaceae bacterium]|nr:SCP2 sterol-binding domain-containing protein [Zoogloeaceae bacterium]
MPMPLQPVLLFALNALLRDAGWAKARLIPFAAKQVTLKVGEQTFYFAVTPEGAFCAGEATAPADATITLSGDAMLHALSESSPDRARFFKDATISGLAEFTETLGFIFRHLEWDIAGKLAPVTGDILA